MRAPSTPIPLAELMRQIGEAGLRLAEIGAAEGAAGNISVYVGWNLDLAEYFPETADYNLPQECPQLAGGSFIVTGSGRRLREVTRDAVASLGVIQIGSDGRSATFHTSPRRLFEKPTSEFNSHLAVHHQAICQQGLNFHTVIHAQPVYLTYLSHIPRYQDTEYLNRHILRWQPETIVQLPQGVGYLPFELPGSPELMAATVAAMETNYKIVLWAKHGVMARSDRSIKNAADRIEYAETGARYEYLNLTNHGVADGLTEKELSLIAAKFGVEQKFFG